MTSESVYQALARRLDAIPNGFPATESGVEIRLLEKIFSPEEAALASHMRIDREPAETIAGRADLDVRDAGRLLKNMARRGLIRLRRQDRQLVFGLMPFIVGFYEEQLPRLDKEIAELVESYFQEAHEAFYGDGPSVHRVIPVEKAIPFELEIFPHERAAELVEAAKSWGVRDCICRLQQRLIGKGCDHETANCLMLAPMESTFNRSETTRPISKDEALHILSESEAAGLVANTANQREDIYYICNCCSCCCGVLRGLTEFEIPAAVAKSDFQSVIDADRCSDCGDCLDRCPVNALALLEEVCTLNIGRCIGCGLCVSACPTAALQMVRRPVGDVPVPPENLKGWMEERARKRKLPMERV